MKGGDISENIRNVLDVMEYTKLKKIEALIIQIDFQKAFDRVSYEALFDCMRYFGYGEQFIYMSSLLFKDMNLCTINMGYLSEFWKPTRGLFQGNPCGPYLFLLVIEVLAIKLKENEKIEGVTVNNVKMLLSQFADDLDMFVKYKKEVWQEIISTFEQFERNSGMKINYDKTSVYRIGSLRNSQARFYADKKIKWSDGPINVLGVQVDYDENIMQELNLNPLVSKAENILRMWKARGLSLFGKVLVVNSLVGSLFLHRMNVMREIPTKWFRKMKGIFSKFIWKGRPKIAWNIMTANKEDGGCGLVDLEKKQRAMKLTWVIKLLRKAEIKNIAYEILENKYGDDIWLAHLSRKDMESMFALDNFWGDVLKEWNRLEDSYFQKEENKGAQSIWLNSQIKIGGKVVYWKNCIEQNIKYWRDLVVDGELRRWQNFEMTYPNVLTALSFNSLVSAISQKYRKIGLTEDEAQHPVKFFENAQKLLKVFYRFINKSSCLLESKANWLTNIIGSEIKGEELRELILKIPLMTICEKLRSFQYKLLNNAILTNVRLKHMAIVENSKCDFCKNETETLVHMFVDCPMVREIWKFIKLKFRTVTTLGVKEIILNTPVRNPRHIENMVVLITKHFIYSCKYSKRLPNIFALKAKIENYKQIEYEIAKSKEKLDSHNIKWSNYC